MNIKNILYSTVVGMAALSTVACSNIDENDRLIYVKPAEVGRAMLIEDFTGQRCVNCPKGTDAINAIVETYGEENVIAVGIHSGPLGFAGSATLEGLMTDTGNEYYNRWDSEKKLGQPWAMFSRSTTPNSDYSTWSASVASLISQKAVMSIDINNSYDEATQTISTSIDVFGTDGTANGKLQVWVIEDGVKAMQLMPDGSRNAEYIHNHVFRAAVNGTWGEDVVVKEGEHTQKQYTYTIPTKSATANAAEHIAWQPQNVSIVAFVYNDREVMQVAKKPIIAKAETDESEE